ncbi:MAG: hypothetical protein HY072_04395 [Deltaproteobacteria bacterium]|nr:hypothetical protein [Deltaproteobacteria bacterium]
MSDKQVVDFVELRAQKIDEKRRKAERILFQQLLNVYCVTENYGLRPIDLVEVSEEGCSFQVPFDQNHLWPKDIKERFVFRLYFSQDTYLPVHVNIANSRPYIDNNGRFTRYGCSVDKTTTTYPAYQQFVKFLKLYSEHAHKDQGNKTVFYI